MDLPGFLKIPIVGSLDDGRTGERKRQNRLGKSFDQKDNKKINKEENKATGTVI